MILTLFPAGAESAMQKDKRFESIIAAENLMYGSPKEASGIANLLDESKIGFESEPDESVKYLGLAYIEYLEALNLLSADKNAAEKKFTLSQDTVNKSLSIRETSDGLRLLDETYQQLMNFKGFFYQAAHGAQLKSIPDKAISLDPDNSRAYTDLSIFYLYSPAFAGGSTDEAQRLLNIALTKAGSDADRFLAYMWLGETFIVRKSKADAADAIGKARAIYPENAWAKDKEALIEKMK
jgi:tetratricopeptide (TPR) repeat protein